MKIQRSESLAASYENEPLLKKSKTKKHASKKVKILPLLPPSLPLPPGSIAKKDLLATDVILGKPHLENSKIMGNKHDTMFHGSIQETVVLMPRQREKSRPYSDVISAWWERYEDATHSEKRNVCRKAVREMHEKGVRFLSQVERAAHQGYFFVQLPDSLPVVNKVLRALRQEVIRHTGKLSPEEETERKMLFATAARQGYHSNNADTVKVSKSCNDPIVSLMPILPNYPSMSLKFSQPKSGTVPTLVYSLKEMMDTTSYTSFWGQTLTPLPISTPIPSAISWGTSDVQSPKASSVSPDTVLPWHLFPHLNIAQSEISDLYDKTLPKYKLNPRRLSFDIADIFDNDEFLNPVDDEDAGPTSPLVKPSKSSDISFAPLDWNDANFRLEEDDIKTPQFCRPFISIDDIDLATFKSIVPPHNNSLTAADSPIQVDGRELLGAFESAFQPLFLHTPNNVTTTGIDHPYPLHTNPYYPTVAAGAIFDDDHELTIDWIHDEKEAMPIGVSHNGMGKISDHPGGQSSSSSRFFSDKEDRHDSHQDQDPEEKYNVLRRELDDALVNLQCSEKIVQDWEVHNNEVWNEVFSIASSPPPAKKKRRLTTTSTSDGTNEGCDSTKDVRQAASWKYLVGS